jgi:hypothetical protein
MDLSALFFARLYHTFPYFAIKKSRHFRLQTKKSPPAAGGEPDARGHIKRRFYLHPGIRPGDEIILGQRKSLLAGRKRSDKQAEARESGVTGPGFLCVF